MKKYLAGLVIFGMIGAGVFVTAQEKTAPPAKPRAAQAVQGQGTGPMAPAPLEMLKQRLGLTPEQVTKLQESRKAQQEAQQGFRNEMQKLRGELAPLLRDPKADPNKVNGLFDQIAKLGAEQAKKGFAGRQNLAKILTPEQLTKLEGFQGRGGQGMQQVQGMGMGMRGRMGMDPGRMMNPRGGMGMGRGMGQGMQQGQGMGMAQGMGMRGRMGMGRGQMMMPRGGMRGPGVGPGLRLRLMRWLRGW